ncbi:anthrax toxin-like adenylyl cyclase domain-containing protein [Aliivibrio wodanis]|uniref:anthrax toxin-like adenylyl cyclase domain-containing protein n=2 Tax=Aliivibrio wodanis TaxID=80852 RepID=UPI00406CC7F1
MKIKFLASSIGFSLSLLTMSPIALSTNDFFSSPITKSVRNDDLRSAIYNIDYDFKKWSDNKKGNVGDLYIYDNPRNGKTEIFRLKRNEYGYFPEEQYSNDSWHYLGPRYWGNYGKIGDIYIRINSNDSFIKPENKYDFFKLLDYYESGSLYPSGQTSNNQWEFIHQKKTDNSSDNNNGSLGEISSGETLSSSIIETIGFHSSGNCGAKITVKKSGQITNNDVIKENTLVNIEVSLFDSDKGLITGSENVIALWKDIGNGQLEAIGRTLFEAQESRTCLITNVSLPGFSRAATNIGSGWSNQIEFPNGDINKGPLKHPYTVAPILSSIFITRMKEDFLSDYIEAIPDNIGDEDFRLVNSGNVSKYSDLMKDILAGNTGINGSNDAGYSIDFLKLKDKLEINKFISNSLIVPAINIGMIDQSLDSDVSSDLLRRYILAELGQDSSYDYGSDNNIKASIALQYSSISTNIQLDDGYYFDNYLKKDYLIDEFNTVSTMYNESLKDVDIRLESNFTDANEITIATYELPYDFKQWSDSGKGIIGDIYIYDNPYTKKTEVFRLKTSNYGFLPTNRSSNDNWDFIGPKNWAEIGNKDDIYIYENPYNNSIDFFKLKNDPSQYFPTDRTSDSNWDYLSPYILGGNNAINISPQSAFDFTILANKYSGLEGIDLSKAILTSSGDIGIDEENRIIFSTKEQGGLLGNNLIDIASLAYQVGKKEVTSAQVNYIKVALDNLLIDSMYSYGSLNNVKSTILNRIAYELMDKTLLEQIGTGNEPFLLDELIKDNSELSGLDFEKLVKNYLTLNFKLNGFIFDSDQHVDNNNNVQLFEHGDFAGQRITISEDSMFLNDFNDILSSFIIPSGWEVRFYENANYQGRYWTRTGSGNVPVHDTISSIKILKKTNIYNEDKSQSIDDILYDGLVELEKVTDQLAIHSIVVAYDNGEKIETIPLTDELYARGQLFKYGLNASAVEDLWKTYLKKGYLRNVSDSRINGTHLSNERKYANKAVQDMWSDYFSSLVPVASNYLSTLIDYKLKILGKEPLDNRIKSKTTLRLAYGFEVDEHIKSRYFNGIWNNWDAETDNWLIYGPDIDYSVKTVNNIYDFMSFSDVTFGGKVQYQHNQQYAYKDLSVFQSLSLDGAEYCSVYEWQTEIPPTKKGALDLESTKWKCNPFYITRSTNLSSMRDSFDFIIAEMMRTKKWDLKTINTERDTLYMILQMFIPIWGTVESFEKGDKAGQVMGMFGDFLFFMPIAGQGVKSVVNPVMKVVSKLKPASIIGRGVSLAVNSLDDTAGAIVQVNKIAAKATAKKVMKDVAKATLAEMNPLDGIGDLARGTVRGISKKIDAIKGGNKVAPLSPKVYKSRNLTLNKIEQGNVDVSSGVGMPQKDRSAFSEVADRENIVVGVRPVDEKSGSLIESGLYGSKSLLVKSKSSDWGPHSGFIPVDQKYAKKSARNSVDKFNHHSQNSLNTGVAVEVPLAITDKRVKELQGFGALDELKFDDKTGMYRANSSVDDVNVTFYYEETSLSGQKGWNVYVREDGELKQLNVMGSPDSNKAMTADYDLFTVMYNNSDFGVENTLRKPKTHEQWKESVVYDDLSPEFKEMYDNKELYDTKGAGTLGTISDRVKDLKNKINNQLGRGKGMEMVHHGADDANPYAVLDDNFPATFFVPKRLLKEDGLGKNMGSINDYFPVTSEGSVILRNPEEFANFHQVIINSHFTGPLNKIWGDQAAGEILSRRARLSHVFLDARDQVAEALGSQIGNYKPYVPPKP